MTADRMLTEDEIFDETIKELTRLLTYCFEHPEYITEYRNQAFGVARFACILAPSWEKRLHERWESWQKSVDNLLQMCYNKVSN